MISSIAIANQSTNRGKKNVSTSVVQVTKKTSNEKKCITCKNFPATFNFYPESRKYCEECADEEQKGTGRVMISRKNTVCIECIAKCTIGNKIMPQDRGDLKQALYRKAIIRDDKSDESEESEESRFLKLQYCGGCFQDLVEDGRIPANEVKLWSNEKSTKCADCKKYLPSYNYPDIKNPDKTRPLVCRGCVKDGMIDVVHPFCKFPGCKSVNSNQPVRALFNFPGKTKAIRCLEHKDKDMIDVLHPTCSAEWCETRVDDPIRFRGFCLRDYVYNFPNEPITRYYKTKERHVVEFVELYFTDYNPIFDKVIPGSTSKRRPDILFDLDTHCVIIEIDEGMHKGYSCENKRIAEIWTSLKERNTVFIRFNPDQYKDSTGKTIPSCFSSYKGNNLPKINDKKAWEFRLNKLKNAIERHVSIIPDKCLTYEHLFFDEI